jgi:outer membrane protein TolC
MRRLRQGAAVVVVTAVVAVQGVAWAQTTPQSAPQTPAAPVLPVPLPQPVMTLEFDAAIQAAVDKNPTVLLAATNINRAEGLLAQSRAAERPTATATVSDATISSPVQFQGATIVPRSQVTITGDISMAIFNAARWAAIAQAMDQVDVAKISTSDVRRQVAVATAEAYLAVFAARRQLEVDGRALANGRAHLDYAQKRLEGGVGSRVNAQRAAQEVSTDQALLENTRLALVRAEEALGVLVGVDGPVAVGAEPAFEAPASTDVAQGLSARTDVQLQRENIKAAERVLGDSKKDWWPTGTLSFDPTYITPSGVFQQAKTWRLTVSFTQQILDGGQRRGLKLQRAAAVDASKQAEASVENQAKSDIRLAQESVASLERALASARQAVDQANDVLQITTTAFEVGATTNLDVIDAERTARDAETAATNAEDAVRRARLDLLVALGRFPH